MSEPLHFIRTENIPRSETGSAPLKNGDSVFVRVLSQNANGSYTVSLLGNRVNVESQRPLMQGESFHAKLTFSKDGQIFLSPEAPLTESEATKAGAGVSAPGLLPDGRPDSTLASILLSQGLVPDAASVRLLQFFQQTGMRIDTNLLQRARLIALRFPGKEKKASEIAALLLSKGITPTDEAIKELLSLLDSESGTFSQNESQQNNQQNNQSENQNEKKKEEDSSQNKLSLFVKKLFPKGIQGGSEGLLTMLNQIKGSSSHWFFLPYTCNNGGVESSGIIRLLLNMDTKVTEKVEINYKNSSLEAFFVLYYSESKVKEVRFWTLPPLLTSDVQREEERLGELLRSGMSASDSVSVTYSPCALIEGLCTVSQVPSVFEKRV